jgi:hypothetical protein
MDTIRTNASIPFHIKEILAIVTTLFQDLPIGEFFQLVKPIFNFSAFALPAISSAAVLPVIAQ